MPVLAFPGPAAPPPPPVTLEVPDGWDALPAGGDLLDGDDDLSRLVVATGRVRGSDLDADDDEQQSVLETLVVGGGA